ncbi:MAG: AAA family ATPase [Candidatus Altiarchaeota archaeon]|nr:AAA family ATPase [Candidatus Altiarchaeota archaeon]
MALVVGLSGRIGSGKGAVAQYLREKYGAEQFVFSKILADVLDRLSLPKTRQNLQKLGDSLRREFHKGVIVDALANDISKSKASLVVVDGIRYVNEVKMLRGFKENVLLYVDAPLEKRYERCVRRGEKGEGGMSLEEFEKSDLGPTELELEKVKGMADHILENTGSIEELHRKVGSILGKKFA